MIAITHEDEVWSYKTEKLAKCHNRFLYCLHWCFTGF